MNKTITCILCSDNHGFEEPLIYLKKKYKDADYFLHCGDSQFPKAQMSGFATVEGNNDLYGEYPFFKVLKIGEHQIYLCHGHRDMMFGHYEMLANKAKQYGCDIACCGHSHIPFAGVVNGVICLNPGSIWHNRDLSDPSYYVIQISGKDITWKKHFYKL